MLLAVNFPLKTIYATLRIYVYFNGFVERPNYKLRKYAIFLFVFSFAWIPANAVVKNCLLFHFDKKNSNNESGTNKSEHSTKCCVLIDGRFCQVPRLSIAKIILFATQKNESRQYELSIAHYYETAFSVDESNTDSGDMKLDIRKIQSEKLVKK